MQPGTPEFGQQSKRRAQRLLSQPGEQLGLVESILDLLGFGFSRGDLRNPNTTLSKEAVAADQALYDSIVNPKRVKRTKGKTKAAPPTNQKAQMEEKIRTKEELGVTVTELDRLLRSVLRD